MARATGSPVPVMAETTAPADVTAKQNGTTAAKGKAGTGASSAEQTSTNASPGSAGASSSPGAASSVSAPAGGSSAPQYLGGPWGASFVGKGPDGKPVQGLTWPRRFTRPGVHPYDEIEWELRTAVIASETGKTVFEQKDVEVPKSWSQLATNVVVSKYFRGHIGTPERERSVKQLIDRVVNTIAAWAETQHYFATDEDLAAFKAELTHLLVHQKMAFNSPVWFNVGIEPRPQTSACFINSVTDDMGSIMDLAKTEAMLFKYGSGSGVNLSPLRGAKERLSKGGVASGPVSFMRGLDAFAGAIKSGGTTRRAAKMVVLNADHPDVLEFIDSKANEEKKAWALIEQGYDPSFTGEAYGSVFFQNANHSVRVTDDFMRAVEHDGDWTTHAVTTGKPVETLKAREVFRRMADAAWICGDPGIQYDTTINDWNPVSNSDRQYATNPCVTGDTLIATDEGWRSIESLVGERANVIGADGQAHPVSRIFPTGTKPVFELQTQSGYRVRITEDHKIATTRGDVAVKDLQPDDRIFLNAPGFGHDSLETALAEAIGLAVGDGCLVWTAAGETERPMVVLTMHANEAGILEAVAVELNAQKRALKAVGSVGRNDDIHVSFSSTGSRLAFASRPVAERFMQYAILDEGGSLKRFKPAAFALDRPSMAAVLRGLFTADGTVVDSGAKVQYVGLDSTSRELLLQAQRMLLSFGIKSKLYENRRGGRLTQLLPDGRGGMKAYAVKEMHSLRITRSSRVRFEREIGFMPQSPKASALSRLNVRVSTYSDELIDRVGSITPLGEEPVFDLTEQATSHFVANGLVVHNCSEFSFLNDTSCNLASVNLMKFVDADGEFDVEAYRYACRTTITAQEILVDNASYPTPKIEENSHRFRPLGLGYANLGALLMSRGLAYDSPEGRNFAAALTAIMTAEAYRQSATIARDHGGPFVEYDKNRAPFIHVMQMHRDAAYRIPTEGVPAQLLEASRAVFDEALELGREHGYRNAQISLLAPTGTIAFMMDCDTTGIEPDIALIKYKKLVGEGYLKIVNQTVPAALRKLGYSADEVQGILDYLNEHETIEGAPGLKPEHLPVFDCAFKPKNGQRSIHYMGHIRMMGAVQPFLSGAISKTVNMPEAATADEIEQVYLEGWKQGLKAIAIYRDGSKRSQPLSTGRKKGGDAAVEAVDSEAVTELKRQLAKAQAEAGLPHRHRLPSERTAITHKFEINGHEGYITVGLYPDGQPGEIFLKMAKEGSTVSGLMDSFATTVSVALQYGVPLRDLVNKFAHVRFEPSGFTGNPEIPIAKSIVDYIFRWLGSRFLSDDDRANLGLIDRTAIAEEPAVAGVLPVAETPTPAPAHSDESHSNAVRANGASGPGPSAPVTPATAGDSTATRGTSEPPRTSAIGTAEAPQAPEGQELAVIAGNDKANGHSGHANGNSASKLNGGGITLNLGGTKVAFAAQADAPSCADCGSIMVRNGSCYKCLNCGSTSGCS
jgi:ribonucleoside-diphosphate reductase alpha chain